MAVITDVFATPLIISTQYGSNPPLIKGVVLVAPVANSIRREKEEEEIGGVALVAPLK
jgi:hypothetical protein